MAITIKSRAKYRVGGKAPKHGYRTRTGPNCCNGGCAAKGPKKQYPYYPSRIRNKIEKG